MPEPQQPQTGNHRTSRTMGERFGLLLTNLGKLGGLVIGFRETFGDGRPVVILYATAIYMGAQALEDLALKVIERLGAPS